MEKEQRRQVLARSQGASVLSGEEETYKCITWQAMTGTRTVTKQGRGKQGHRRPLRCRDLSTEQRPKESKGNGTGPKGSCPSMSEDHREARVASGQATGRVAEVQGGACGAVGFLLHAMGTHSGFGGVERDPP